MLSNNRGLWKVKDGISAPVVARRPASKRGAFQFPNIAENSDFCLRSHVDVDVALVGAGV